MSARLLLLTALCSTAASAHIKLTAPAPALVTDAAGNPQKTAPCGGAGTASNQVTTVVAGSQLLVQWLDTVPHPGHYRISIAPNPNQFVDPAHVETTTNCVSATVQSPVMAPTLADGVLPHTTGAVNMPREVSVTVPSTPCADCTLQLLQFMSSHAPPCFYYQCAKLRIVAADAGTPSDAGSADAGGSDAGPGPTPDAGAGDAGTDGGAAGGDAGASPDGGVGALEPAGGCGCTASPGLLAVLALAAWAARRRTVSPPRVC